MSDSDAKDCSDSNSRDSILKSSRLNAPLRSSVLRPSLFGSNLSNNDNSCSSQDNKTAKTILTMTTTTTTAAAAADVAEATATSNTLFEDSSSNPFLKDDPELKSTEQNDKKEDEKNNDNSNKNDPLAMLSKNGLPRSNLFAATKNSIPRVEQTGFVFGQNVHERVTGAIENAQGSSSTNKGDNELEKQSEEPTGGENSNNSEASGLLFSSAIQKSNKSEDGLGASKENGNKSLTEVAREYEESRAQKRKYEEVETFTGEENEVNILDINCKLFAFVNRNWEERGRGSLRLNDSKDENGCSRVVFRTSGNFRLLVNTKVWNGMVAERPSQKSLRLTAMDNTGQIKVFLMMSRPDDISILHKALTKRINECKHSADENLSPTSNGKNDKVEKENNDSADGDGIDDDIEEKIQETVENEKDKKEKEEKENECEEKNTNDVPKDNNSDDDDKYEPSPKKVVVDGVKN